MIEGNASSRRCPAYLGYLPRFVLGHALEESRKGEVEGIPGQVKVRQTKLDDGGNTA